MEKVQLDLSEKERGSFFIEDEAGRVAHMNVGIRDGLLIAIHTEAEDRAKGRGLGKLLLDAMVAYARENSLKVLPLCPYVYAQFKRHPAEYADLWYKGPMSGEA